MKDPWRICFRRATYWGHLYNSFRKFANGMHLICTSGFVPIWVVYCENPWQKGYVPLNGFHELHGMFALLSLETLTAPDYECRLHGYIDGHCIDLFACSCGRNVNAQDGEIAYRKRARQCELIREYWRQLLNSNTDGLEGGGWQRTARFDTVPAQAHTDHGMDEKMEQGMDVRRQWRVVMV